MAGTTKSPDRQPAQVISLRQRKVAPLQLVENSVSQDVIEAAEMLLNAARSGELTGLAFVAMRRRGRYFTDSTGSCASNPTLTRGALGELTDKVSDMQHSIHHDDAR